MSGHVGRRAASVKERLRHPGEVEPPDFRYTKHQVARGSRPDAVSGDRAYLLKNTSIQRLTYQIRLLTFLASERGNVLILRIPKTCRLSGDMRAFAKDHRRWLTVERV